MLIDVLGNSTENEAPEFSSTDFQLREPKMNGELLLRPPIKVFLIAINFRSKVQKLFGKIPMPRGMGKVV